MMANVQLMPRVVVVTLNWNGEADTLACVRALLAMDYPNFQVVVCDNASRPESWQALQALGALDPAGFAAFNSAAAAQACTGERGRVTLIQTGSNLGFAGGVNVGLRYALADPTVAYCWILNNDTEAHPHALTALVERTMEDSHIGLCGSSLVLFHDRERVQAFGGARYLPWRARSAAIGMGAPVAAIPDDPHAVEAEMAYVNGASMLASRAFMESVGLMDERYFLYSEEHDWAQRGRGRFKLGYAPRSLVFHKHGATIGTAPSGGSQLSLFYLYRNKLAFVRRHHPQLYVLAWMFLAWDACKFVLKGDPKRAKAIFAGLLAEPSMPPMEAPR